MVGPRRCPDSGSVSSERRKPSVCLDARPNTKPKVTVVSMAWFEYLRLSAWLPARRPRRVPVGELAIGESEPDGQTPASAETRLVLPPIPDTVGLLDVLRWVRLNSSCATSDLGVEGNY